MHWRPTGRVAAVVCFSWSCCRPKARIGKARVRAARLLTFVSAMATLVAIASMAPADVAGQAAAPARKAAAPGAIPRMPDGKPDLQGTYDIGTLTPLQRTAGTPLVMTAEEAKKLEQQVAARSDNLNATIAADAPRRRARRRSHGRMAVGGYTSSGSTRARAPPRSPGKRDRCSSLADGRVPALTPERSSVRPEAVHSATTTRPLAKTIGVRRGGGVQRSEMRPLAERA